MHNVEKWPNILKKSLQYVWPFFTLCMKGGNTHNTFITKTVEDQLLRNNGSQLLYRTILLKVSKNSNNKLCDGAFFSGVSVRRPVNSIEKDSINSVFQGSL